MEVRDSSPRRGVAPLNLQVNRVAGALGAEIHGIDLAVPQAEATIAAVRALLLEHGVIFFRGQRLNDTMLKAFAGCFGTFFRHPYFVPEDDPDVIVVRRAPGDKRIVGEGIVTLPGSGSRVGDRRD